MRNYIVAMILTLMAGCSGDFDRNATSTKIDTIAVMSFNAKDHDQYTKFKDSLSTSLRQYSEKIK